MIDKIRNAYYYTVNRPLGRHKPKQEDVIEMDLTIKNMLMWAATMLLEIGQRVSNFQSFKSRKLLEQPMNYQLQEFNGNVGTTLCNKIYSKVYDARYTYFQRLQSERIQRHTADTYLCNKRSLH
jgi:hypothetical protein